MTLDEALRLFVVFLTICVAITISFEMWKWHTGKDPFSVRDYFTDRGKDGKEHPSRAALGEMVALIATTSGYLTTLAVRPQDYETSTLVYGGLWVIRGGYSKYLRSKQK